MDNIPIKIEFPNLVTKTLSPLADKIGATLADLWDISFGWIENSREKVQYKRALSLDQFKESLEKGVSQIPPENLCEPKISIIGPAMEASKYYFEEKELREMFSKLIVCSLNSSKSNMVHPSFIEIIKQLSSTDAILLKKISEYNDFIPAIGCSIVMKIKGLKVMGQAPQEKTSPYTVTFPLDSQVSEQDQMVSLDNLNRLGLIQFKDLQLSGPSKYKFAKSTSLYKDSQKEFDTLAKNGADPDYIHIHRKCFGLTATGIRFCNTCIADANTIEI